MKNKITPTYRPGDDALFDLFDTGDTDHVRDLLVDLADPVPEAHRAVMAETLRRLLGKPIDLLRNRLFESARGANSVEFEPLNEFALAVEVAAQRLSLPCPAMDRDEAREIADSLHTAWLFFIAYASAHRMYDDLPRELETNKRKTSAMLDKRGADAHGRRVDHDLIVKEYAKRKANGDHRIAEAIAQEYGLAVGTVKNIWSKRKK